jgi:hypothetical protein
MKSMLVTWTEIQVKRNSSASLMDIKTMPVQVLETDNELDTLATNLVHKVGGDTN